MCRRLTRPTGWSRSPGAVRRSGAYAPGATPGELAERTGLTTGPTTRLIDRLEQAGHVRRVPDPGDRRRITVEPVGEPVELDRVMAPARRRIGEILGDRTPEQLDVLFDYFTRAAEAYQEAAAQLRDGTAGH